MVNAAVIGIGNMGKNHARVYSELSGVNLVSIADVDERSMEIARKLGCEFYSDYAEMLKSEDIDAISIAVPTKLHKKVALDCINAGKHVLVEKPIAESVDSAQKIISAAEKGRRVLMVGHIERFNPAVQKLKQIIRKGKLGEITSIIARRVGIFPPQIKDANVILDLAVHDIDVFGYLLEKQPLEVFAKAGRALNGTREDHAMILLNYGATTCLSHVNWITPVKIRNLAVTGTKGYAELNYISQDLKIYQSVYERAYDSFGDFVVKFGMPQEMNIKVVKEEPLKVELGHFVSCVKNGSEPIASGRDALLALRLSLCALESYRKNKPVGVTL